MVDDDRKVPVSDDDRLKSKEINIAKFADARSAEMYHFEEVLKNKHKESTRTPMQTVPKHMRRRAMSHNRFRVPSRIRALNSKYLRDNEKHILRCRKHARNSKLLLLHYFKRSLKPNKGSEGEPTNFMSNKWLETHLWHARRMSMQVYCGYKIAEKSRQKQIRTTAAFSHHNCLIYDKSYYCMVKVSGEKSHLLLERVGNLERGKGKDAMEVNLGDSIGQVICLKSSPSSIVLIALTALQPHIDALFTNAAAEMNCEVSITDINDLMNVFELIGPRSLEVLNKTLSRIDHRSSSIVSLMRRCGVPPPCVMPVLASVAVDCRFDQSRYASMPEDCRLIDAGDNVDLPAFVAGLKDVGFGGVREFMEGLACERVEGYLGRFVEARRGQYSHKRKKKPTDGAVIEEKGTEKIEDELAKVESKKMDIELAEEDEKKVRGLLHKIREDELKEFKVLIVNTSVRSSDLNRVLVMVPSGYGKRLWRKLCQIGAKAMGRVEYDHTYHQFSLPVFPQDNPESILFHEFESSRKAKTSTIHFRRPPAKRPNFLKLKSPFPFACSFSSLAPPGSPFGQSFSKITMTSLFTGVPDDGAYICYPQESDMVSLLRDFDTSNRVESSIMNREPPVLSVTTSMKDEMFKYPSKDAFVKMLDDLELADCDRPIVGRLTSGFLHFGKARGFGFGAVLTAELAKLREISDHLATLKGAAYLKLSRSSVIALFRNPSSAFYHFCTISEVF